MLEEKIVLVISASRGVGRQIALTLDRESTAVIVNYNGSAAKAEEVVKKIETAGGKAEVVQCNIPDFESYGRMMVDMASRYGHLDILVNSAGITRDNLLTKMSKEDFDAAISTNLKGILNRIKHISRQMLEQKVGGIINISSVSGVLGNTGQADCYAAKVGVIDTTKSAAGELASRGTTVNAVTLGPIVTEMTDVLSDNIKAATMEQISMKHFGSTQDIAEAVAFLASDKAGYITGQILSVDGGMAMQDALVYAPGCRKIGVRLV